MNIRRMTLAVGAATGGVLAAGFLSTAVAFADGDAAAATDPFTAPGTDAFTIDGYTFDPYLATGTDAGDEGFNPVAFGDGAPSYFATGNVDQSFDVFQTASGATTPTDIGSITTNENVTTLFNITSTGFEVTGSTPAAATDVLPADGSTFDVTNYGGGYFNDYSDVLGGTEAAPTSTVTDTLITPFGDLNLTPYFTAFDLTNLDPASAFGETASTAAADALGGLDPLSFLGL